MTVSIFGIRHHGSGCSRALVSALEDYNPDLLLVEGPPEGTDAIKYAASPEMRPPVALIVYPEADPKRAAIYPFAAFSPEWVALRYAIAREIPVEFMDLPVANRYGLEDAVEAQRAADELKSAGQESEQEELQDGELVGDSVDASYESEDDEGDDLITSIREDPLGTLARVAGETDPERWEERVIEQASTPGAIFPAFLDAMTELRCALLDAAKNEAKEEEETNDESSAKTEESALGIDLAALTRLARSVARASGGNVGDLEPLREAAMRRAIRAAMKTGAQRIAVVCGAWHAPALDLEADNPKRSALIPKKSRDDALLAKLPKVKTAATWIPWTHSRLDRRTGYGAGVESPAWLAEIWRVSEEAERLDALCNNRAPKQDCARSYAAATTTFLARAARFLRDDKMQAAAANVVDAARFSETLAALRMRSTPNLDDLRDAAVAVLCGGERLLYGSIRERLEIGTELGAIPSDAPATPLAKNIEAERKRLRLKREELPKNLDIDLRQETGREKSRFLRRMAFIDAPWATPRQDERRALGAFRETWTIAWKPEFDVVIVDASKYGATLLEAASNMAVAELDKKQTLADVMELVERALPAELNDDALERVFRRLRNDAAVSSDVNDALEALPALARALRYGSTRGRADSRLAAIFDALFERVILRLKEVCVNLTDDVAETVVAQLAQLVDAIMTLEDSERLDLLLDAFEKVALDDETSKYVVGALTRSLYDRKRWSEQTLADKLAFFIGRATPPNEVASWLQGFLYGQGQTILWLDELWRVFDGWLANLDQDVFIEELPLLRRAFDSFSDAERRSLGQTVASLYAQKSESQGDVVASSWDDPNARALIPILDFILSGKPLDAAHKE